MRYLILSDIHANIDALESVLAASPAADWDRVVVLGDLVGYGAAPNEVIDRVRELAPLLVIRGNHDKAACGLDDASSFNTVARASAMWTMETLTASNREYLKALPAGPLMLGDGAEICHGAPFDEDYYIFDGDDARRAMATTSRPLCLFGHTHLPVVFSREGRRYEGQVPAGHEETPLAIRKDVQYLVNAGAVGQPRDGDSRAAFGIFDETQRQVTLRRVVYPIDAAQRRIHQAGLPAALANRLAIGR